MSSPPPVFALVDCNNFYASCEKLFDPRLAGRAVVVLSNNDGCVVARSAEAKVLGVPMGAPWFKLAGLAQRHGIIALSSNYALYADMSNRVIEVLASFTPRLEVYSIDECFLDLAGFAQLDLVEYSYRIRDRVSQWLGLPVCIGIAPTKTLAKLANHLAKKRLQYAGVCDLRTIQPAQRAALFAEIGVGEVWGVGGRLQDRLATMAIRTVEDLRRANPELIRRRFSVALERTVRELNDMSCLELEEVAPPRQQIIASRSFGNAVFLLEELREAVASHISRAAEKLRAQGSEVGALTVMICTNPFKPQDPQYQRAVTVPLSDPTSDTRKLIAIALRVLDGLYRSGFAYHKAGIMLAELMPAGKRQQSLFDELASDARAQAVMVAMDAINHRWGRSTLKSSVIGTRQGWKMRQERRTPDYTTSWSDLPVVVAR